MKTLSVHLPLGLYRYTYPTFVDTPQLVCVHFFTPDCQHAFVTFPRSSAYKMGRLVPIHWFDSINMAYLDESSRLMHFLAVTLPDWLTESGSGAKSSLVDATLTSSLLVA